MPNIGGPELIIILVIVLIVFGAGRLPDVFGQLGKGIRTFRDASSGEDAKGAAAAASTTSAGSAKYCSKCGTALSAEAKFCPSCGTPTGTA